MRTRSFGGGTGAVAAVPLAMIAWWTVRILTAEKRATAGLPGDGAMASLPPRLRGDAIVVFGASVHEWGPSGELRARLDHAARLWRLGAAPVLVASGGVDREIDEIESMTRYLVTARGIPSSAVRPARPGDNTRATVAALRRLGARRWVAVSSPYHACRIEREAARQGVELVVSAPARTPEMQRARARFTQRFSELLANVWYAAPTTLTSRLPIPRLRHTLPPVLSGYRLPERSPERVGDPAGADATEPASVQIPPQRRRSLRDRLPARRRP